MVYLVGSSTSRLINLLTSSCIRGKYLVGISKGFWYRKVVFGFKWKCESLPVQVPNFLSKRFSKGNSVSFYNFYISLFNSERLSKMSLILCT